jgi:hypothetical protein
MRNLSALFILLMILFIGCSTEEKTSVSTNSPGRYSVAPMKITKLDSDYGKEMHTLDSLFGPIDSTEIARHPIELDDSGHPIFRAYDPRCNCETPLQGSDGKPRVSENSPYSDYANDTSLWYWKHPSKEFPDMKVYDLKPQYVDSFLFPDGKWFQAPKWVVADWKKDAAERYKDSIPVNGYWVRVSIWDYEQWLKKQRSSP